MEANPTTSLSDLIIQLNALIANYEGRNSQLSDGLRGYIQGLREARHLAQNLHDREL
jgi:hypothetical protein